MGTHLLRNVRVQIFLLLAVYFASRLYHLTILPIFTDEAIYIYWAKFIAATHSHWFLSLTDGKPPVLTWIIGIFLTIFPPSWYLIAGRLPSVLFGAISFLGTYYLAKLLFNSKKVAFLAALFVIFSPFMLVYDRLALYDAQLTAMLIWAVYFMLKASKTMSLKYAVLWGFFLGLGFLSKPPAILYLLLTPVCFLIMTPVKTIRHDWKRILFFIILVVAISEGMNNLQRISGAYQQSLIKNQQFQQPITELLKNPLGLTFGNMYIFAQWVLTYYTPPLLVASILGFLVMFFQKRREGLILFILWFVPMVILATVGREIFPRYLVFLTPYALIAAAYLLYRVWNYEKYGKIFSIVLLVVLLLLPMRFCYLLLTDPSEAPFPTSDFNQLVAEHPSGFGLDRVFAYIDQEAKKGKVTVVTQGTFGLYPYAFYLQYWHNPLVRVIPRWPLGELDQEIYDAKKDGLVIVVLKEEKALTPGLHELQLIERIEKPKSTKYPILMTTIR